MQRTNRFGLGMMAAALMAGMMPNLGAAPGGQMEVQQAPLNQRGPESPRPVSARVMNSIMVQLASSGPVWRNGRQSGCPWPGYKAAMANRSSGVCKRKKGKGNGRWG